MGRKRLRLSEPPRWKCPATSPGEWPGRNRRGIRNRKRSSYRPGFGGASGRVEPANGAGRTGRWGLRNPRTRSWPDRSALAPAMRKFMLRVRRSPFPRVGGLGTTSRPRFRGLAGDLLALGSFGDVHRRHARHRERARRRLRRGRINQTLRANRDGHATPPRAARENPGTGSGNPILGIKPVSLPATDLACGRSRDRPTGAIAEPSKNTLASPVEVRRTHPRVLHWQV